MSHISKKQEKLPLNIVESEKFIGYSCQVNIDLRKICFDYLGNIFVFQGHVTQPGTEPGNEIINSFRNLLRDGNIFPGNPTELILQFSDLIPKNIGWYNYYMDSKGNIIFSSPKDVEMKEGTIVNVVSKIEKIMALQLGINISNGFSSTLSRIIYRCICIVCEYKDQTIEYRVLFDSFKVLGFADNCIL